MPSIAPRRSDFRPEIPQQKVKKIGPRFERPAKVLRLINVGAVIPPHRLYSARAPIHPKRPYGLTRPVVPPDGSFVSGLSFRLSPHHDINGYAASKNPVRGAKPPCMGTA